VRIHHLNCISSCPLGGRLMDGRSASAFQRGMLCCHCVLAESRDGLVLVDTGYGLQDVRRPKARLSGFFLKLLAPDFREEHTALRQVEGLGWRAADVRHIVLTHLDFDHAGGLDDFPHATVHLMAAERDAARAQKTWLDRQRFRPQQWGSQPRWRVHGRGGGRWMGFDGVASGDDGLPAGVLMVPLHGHTLGHAGIALAGGPRRWLLHAGDAYFHRDEMDPLAPRCTPGLRLYQTMMDKDRRARLDNQQRLREVRAHEPEVELFCAHDPVEFERLAAGGETWT
jgi:glyoxylase-like metal-dependent hydrolase (beta-lactamase superfamily II)